MEENKPLEILDADNIDFKAELSDADDSNNESEATNITPEYSKEEDIDRTIIADIQEDKQCNLPIEPNEMALDEPGFFYNILHILDDIYVYSRTVIENNYFNLSDNADFNLVYPNIYVGNYSTSTNLELLQGLGITHIITVLHTFNPPFPEKFTYLHIPAYDDETQNLEPFFQQTNQFISDVLTQRGKLLIHCMVGRSRSVSVLMAFLINIIKGYFNQSLVDTNSINDVSNEIEYNKIIGKHTTVITDGVAPVRYSNKSRGADDLAFQNNEEISRVEYLQPEFDNKYRKFINYKKDLMLREIEKLIDKYKADKSNDLYTDILAYVKKYRVIACPNIYFEKQLRMILND